MMEEKVFTAEEVQKHCTRDEMYVVVHGDVIDVTEFCDMHPGGEEVLMDVAGKDATIAFEDIGHTDEAREELKRLKIGILDPDEKLKMGAIPASADYTTSSPKFGSAVAMVIAAAAILIAFRVFVF